MSGSEAPGYNFRPATANQRQNRPARTTSQNQQTPRDSDMAAAGGSNAAPTLTADEFAAALRQLAPELTEEQKILKTIRDLKVWGKFFVLGDKTSFNDWYAHLESLLDLAGCAELLEPDQNGVGRMSADIQQAAKKRISTFLKGNDIYRMKDPALSVYQSIKQLRETKLGAIKTTYQKYSDMLINLHRHANEGVVQFCDRASEYFRMVRDHSNGEWNETIFITCLKHA